MPGPARAVVRFAGADGGEPIGCAAHAGALRQIWHRDRARRRRRPAGLCRAQDARGNFSTAGRHLPLRRHLRQSRTRPRSSSIGRNHDRGQRDAAALRQPATGTGRDQHDLHSDVVERLLRCQSGGRSDDPTEFRARPPDHRDRAARHGHERYSPGGGQWAGPAPVSVPPIW